MSEGELSGRVALVTGGSRGLGREIALGLAEAGAAIAVVSRNAGACDAVGEEIRARGGRAHGFAAHVGRWDELPSLVDAVTAHFGRLDVLVNNAGKSLPEPSLDATGERLFDAVLDLCLKGPFRLAVLAAEAMRASADGVVGSIVNVSSIQAARPATVSVPYSAAKAGLENLTIGLARALAPDVRVNAVRPGSFATYQVDPLTAEERGRLDETTALGRVGRPEEIVGAVRYLASDAASFTTGAVIAVDGCWG